MSDAFLHCLLPYYDHEKDSLDQYQELYIKIESALTRYFKNQSVTLILNHAWEITCSKELETIYNFFKTKFKKNKIILIYSVSYDRQPDNQDIISYNFFQNLTVNSYKSKGHEISETWNYTENFKGLFLTGKPNKLQRILPLSYFYDNGYLNENLEWSFHYQDHHYDYLKENLNYNETELKTFIEAVSRKPDEIKEFDQSFDHNGFPYDVNLYRDTNWSIISESSYENEIMWITEKTYRAILNRHPFFILGQQGTLESLKSKGYRTFDYVCKYPYDNLKNEERLYTVLKNINWLRDNWNTIDVKRIRADVEYNFNILEKNCIKEHKRLAKILISKNKIVLADLATIKESIRTVNLDDLYSGRLHLIYYNWFGEPDPIYGYIDDLD